MIEGFLSKGFVDFESEEDESGELGFPLLDFDGELLKLGIITDVFWAISNKNSKSKTNQTDFMEMNNKQTKKKFPLPLTFRANQFATKISDDSNPNCKTIGGNQQQKNLKKKNKNKNNDIKIQQGTKRRGIDQELLLEKGFL